MMPRLGATYAVDLEVISKPRAAYNTAEYAALGLPKAPAIMVGDDLVTEGKDVDDLTVDAAICRHLGLPEQEAARSKSFLSRLFRR